MALQFPSGPSNGQSYIAGGKTYIYNSAKGVWKIAAATQPGELEAVAVNIIPSQTETVDLGSPTNRFNDLYLSGNTIDLGGTTLSAATVTQIGNNTSDVSNLQTTVSNLSIPSSVNDLTDVDTTTTAPVTGQALVYDGTKFAPGDVATSGGGGANTKTYSYVGSIQENVSTERLYVAEASTLNSIRVDLGTTGNTNAEIQLKKNGTVINTINIPANTATVTTASTESIAAGDYFTVDITKSSSATNLYVTLLYGSE